MRTFLTTVTYNAAKNLDFFGDSICRNLASLDGVIVIDNGSRDDTIEMLHQLKRQVTHQASELKKECTFTVVENGENVGYAKAINQGVVASLESGAEFILVTNNDVVMRSDALHTLSEDAETMKADVVGVPITSDGKRYLIGNTFDAEAGRTIPHSSLTEEEIHSLLKHSSTCDTWYVHGGIVFFRRSFFEKVGLYDEYLFFGGDENDFSYRIRASAMPVRAVVSLRAYDLFDHLTHHDGRFKLRKARMIMQGETYVLMKHGYGVRSRTFWKRAGELFKELGKGSLARFVVLSLLFVRALIVNSLHIQRRIRRPSAIH